VALALEQLDPPKALSIWRELAELHDGAGRSGERDGALRAALAIDPDDAEARALAKRWGVRVAGLPAASSSHLVPMSLVPATLAPEVAAHVAPLPPPPVPRTATPPPPPVDAGASGLTPRPSSEATRVLSEAEVFVKYGLLERAADHLRRLLDREPEHAEARSRLDSVLKQLGRAPVADDPAADVATPPPVIVASADVLEAAPSPIEEEELTARVAIDELAASEAPTGIGTEAAPAPAPGIDDAADAGLDDELSEVDFFVEQSLLEDARATLADLAERFPNHPRVLAKMREIDMQTQADATGVDASPGALPRDPTGPVHAESGPPPALPKAVMASGGEADLSTHGDLGIAYKEMGLLDAAIAEFKHLVADPTRKVFALTMIGECLEAQGALPDAVGRYKEALNSERVADAESAQLYYLLGSAFERLGDNSEALYFFEKVAKRGGQFRDVARRIEALKPGAAGAHQ
jgi:tetratricopeptide (TPR) repeat protein